jgi:hypothetical protein
MCQNFQAIQAAMSHSEVSYDRAYLAKQRDRWWEVFLYGAIVGPLMLFIGVSGLALSLLAAYAEYRLFQEGASTKGVVFKRNHQGSDESEKHSLSVAYTVAPFKGCQDSEKTPQPGSDCTAKNTKWPLWLSPDSAHGFINGMDLSDQEEASTPIQSRHGQSFRRAVAVDSQTYNELDVGSSVTIRYMRSNPNVVRLERSFIQHPIGFIKGRSHLFVGLPLFLVMSLFSLYGGLVGLRCSLVSGYRLIRLRFHGRSAQAQIIDRWVNNVDGPEGPVSHYCVAYRFQPSNAHQQIAAEINSYVYNRVEIGSVITAKFLPKHPEVCRLIHR